MRFGLQPGTPHRTLNNENGLRIFNFLLADFSVHIFYEKCRASKDFFLVQAVTLSD